MKLKIFRIIIILLLVAISPFLKYKALQFFSKAAPTKANIIIDTRKIVGFINPNWKALAQGGEEKGTRMLEQVVPEIADLYPSYIRIDHIYDYYEVVSRDSNSQLVFNWDQLDQTVCDIYHTGAKPFFSLGYMPSVISEDGSLISKPKNWNEWSLVVQKTIEHYSGQSTRLCGQVTGKWLEDIYYEVWNEPDLETFGAWDLYDNTKDYKTLYYYSVIGANKARNVNRFLIGGPATTAAYKNWFMVFADYILEKKIRIDFLSWHHYSKTPDDFSQDLTNLDKWLSEDKYVRFRHLPKIISEWSYDSKPNPIADTNVGAAHTIASIRNLIEQQVEMGFSFEIKDGQTPSWGILSYHGQKKPRYSALKLLNLLDRPRLQLDGEGTYVRAIASSSYNKIVLILVNYDPDSLNTELVPVTFNNLAFGNYQIIETDHEGRTTSSTYNLTDTTLKKSVVMTPNNVIAIELIKQ